MDIDQAVVFAQCFGIKDRVMEEGRVRTLTYE